MKSKIPAVLTRSTVSIRALSIVAFFALLVFATLLISSHQPTFAQTQIPPSNPALNLNTVSITFTFAQINPNENNQVVRAFVPTGSTSGDCLATLNDTNIFPLPNALFCGDRTPSALGGTPGVTVSIFLAQPATPTFAVRVTLYQRDAKTYGAPVLCNTDGC
jgi:hypothetical protein